MDGRWWRADARVSLEARTDSTHSHTHAHTQTCTYIHTTHTQNMGAHRLDCVGQCLTYFLSDLGFYVTSLQRHIQELHEVATQQQIITEMFVSLGHLETSACAPRFSSSFRIFLVLYWLRDDVAVSFHFATVAPPVHTHFEPDGELAGKSAKKHGSFWCWNLLKCNFLN